MKRYRFNHHTLGGYFTEDSSGEYIEYSDYEKLKAQLEKAEDALQIYANENNWANLTSVIFEGAYLSKSNLFVDDYGDYNLYNVKCQGQRAREYFKEKGSI